MIVKTLSKNEAQAALTDWHKQDKKNPSIPRDYHRVRTEIQKLFSEAREMAESEMGRQDYLLDMIFGVKLFLWLKKQSWFSLKWSADPGFWRFLTVKVAPDVVDQRWGDNPDRYWRTPVRNYFRYVWWYANLTWQGDERKTISLLKNRSFNSDTMMNLVERTGRHGQDLEMTRKLVLYFSRLNSSTIRDLMKGKLTLFRAILKLNTACSEVIEPSLCTDGTAGYVRYLFETIGVQPEQYPDIFENKDYE